jgi:ABC-type Na+ efflux pump permease subunit
MIPWPVLRRELRATAGRRETLVARTGLGLAWGTLAVVIGLGLLGDESWWGHTYSARGLRQAGTVILIGLAGLPLAISGFLVPGLVGGSIAEERERGTWDALLLTRLDATTLVLAKLLGRLPTALTATTIALPLAVLAAGAAGLPPAVIALIVAVELSTVVAIAALAVVASARHDKAAQGRGAAQGLAGAWLLGFPILSVMPIRLPTGLAELVAAAKALCALIAPSSPVSLMTDRAWLTGPLADNLRDRLVTMLAMQAGLVLLAVWWATARIGGLRAGPSTPAWVDPYRGYRPPCGDDPIFWREHELPSRHGSPPKLCVWLRYLLALVGYALGLVRSFLIIVLQIFGVTIALAIPLGLAGATIWYGYYAFLELWRYGSDPAGPYQARTALNLLVRGATAILALPILGGIAASAATRFINERDKGTWPVLLTTPLEGAEIIGSKARASAMIGVGLARLLGPVWLVGVVCGAVHPLGALVAGLDWALAAWAGIALGTYLGARPRSSSAANSAAATASLALVVPHAAVVVGALCSGRDLDLILSWDLRFRLVITATFVAIPLTTAAGALWLTRRSLRKFDEWADRPRRSDDPHRTSPGSIASTNGVASSAAPTAVHREATATTTSSDRGSDSD